MKTLEDFRGRNVRENGDREILVDSPKKLNVEKSMGMSFFTSCPLTGGLSVPLQTVRTSNSSLSSRAFVRVRRFEAAYRLVFVRAW